MRKDNLMKTVPQCSIEQCRPSTPSALSFLLIVGFWCPTAILVAQEPNTGEISKIAQELTSALEKLGSDPTVDNRVRVATWRLLLAELATERGDSVSLWSVATDQFVEGVAELREIEDAIAKIPELERQLSEAPAIAMRLDAARVRRGAIEQRAQLARNAERQRLNQLRAIAKEYRDLLAKMSEVDLYLRLEDYSRVRTANADVLKGIGKIHEIARSRKDYHLFDDEPTVEADSDFKMVQSTPAPLNVELIAHLKAIQALATCRLALRGESPDNELLKEATSWANAALNGEAVPGLELPEGHAADNPLGHYVLGLASESSGVQTTRLNPAAAELHQQARPFFLEANKQFKLADAALSKSASGNEVLAQLAAEIANRTKSLESDAPFLSRSESETLNGRPQAAWDILSEATTRHRNQRLWSALLDAGRRAGVDQKDLQHAIDISVQEDILTENDCSAQVVLMKAMTDAVWGEVGREGVAKIAAERRQQLAELLEKQSAVLRNALDSEQNDLVRVQGQAFLSLAIAYHSLLSQNIGDQGDALREAHRLSRDAMAALERALSGDKNEMLVIALREALIASRLSYGHISVLVLPDYRDDALLGFAAAFDEMAKLPFRRGDVSILGSPMISAMAARTDESGTELAFEERRYRELVTRFLEGMYTLQFGNPGAAADQMATALRLGQQAGGTPGQTGPRDAGVMLGQTDGFDAQVTLHDSVRAFKVLADIKAGRNDTALVECIRILVPDASLASVENVNQTILNAAIDRIQSPLVGFAFASALEANVDSLDLEQSSRRAILLSAASAAFDRVEQQLKSHRMQNRYPHLAALVGDARQRLGSVDVFLDRARQLRARGDLKGSGNALVDGLKRHPQAEALLRLYLETQIEQARRGDESEETLRQLLDRIARVEQMNISPFQHHFYSAVLHELLGDTQSSLQAYEDALAAAEQPRDRVLARSKASQLRVRLAAAGN
jgi:hypothetical protein